jgi:ribonuclease HI
MELLAVIVGLEKLKNPNTKVLVVSDSKYGWFNSKKNGFLVGRKTILDRKMIYGSAC